MGFLPAFVGFCGNTVDRIGTAIRGIALCATDGCSGFFFATGYGPSFDPGTTDCQVGISGLTD